VGVVKTRSWEFKGYGLSVGKDDAKAKRKKLESKNVMGGREHKGIQ